ncbi:MAG: hypothetical protein GXP53_01015 [Deltaproteobacteria bacterium]|nr:hypothetical protein [Deltaproteobacteria bacterium]
MKKKWIVTCAVIIVVFGAGFTATALAGDNGDQDIRYGTIQVTNQTETAFPGIAKIGPIPAAMTAMEKVNGKMLKMGLENENGFLVYDVEVVTPEKSIMDVKVDAGSGKVLSVKKDDADHENDDRDNDVEDRNSENTD